MLPLIQREKGELYDWRAAQTTNKNEKVNN